MRVPAFVSGGLLPAARRGIAHASPLHIADWAATFLELAGGTFAHDARAAAATPPLPQPDSLSLAPFLLGRSDTTPRAEVPLPVGWAWPTPTPAAAPSPGRVPLSVW